MQEDAFEKEHQTVEEGANQGMTQQRGVAAEGADRCRATLEVQQDIHGWFDETVEPFMAHARPLLILVGKHCRLSNNDDEGRMKQSSMRLKLS